MFQIKRKDANNRCKFWNV